MYRLFYYHLTMRVTKIYFFKVRLNHFYTEIKCHFQEVSKKDLNTPQSKK